MRYLEYSSDKYNQPIKVLHTSMRYEGQTVDGSTVGGSTVGGSNEPVTTEVSEITLWGVMAIFTLLFILITFWK